MSEMIERVARAIDAVQLFSRFNDWTSDKTPGCPIEICRYGTDDEEDIVVVERFGGDITESEALGMTISKLRAHAAIAAMRVPDGDMVIAGNGARYADQSIGMNTIGTWHAMIDAALK